MAANRASFEAPRANLCQSRKPRSLARQFLVSRPDSGRTHCTECADSKREWNRRAGEPRRWVGW